MGKSIVINSRAQISYLSFNRMSGTLMSEKTGEIIAGPGFKLTAAEAYRLSCRLINWESFLYVE